MKLVIAEKPSVAKDIASVIGATSLKDKYYEGNNYIVTWAVGHLLTLKLPEMYNSYYEKWRLQDLPIIPNPFEYYVIKNTQSQFKVIQELWKRQDIDTVICGTDAGREGELIFRLISNKINIKKNMQRLWISSMTDEAIKEGFNNLKPLSNYDYLYKSAIARQQADWLVGLNATRFYSIKSHSKLTAGRVQTATLNLIVTRYNEILNFQKSFYYNLVSEFENFKAIYYDKENNSKLEKSTAEEILEEIKGLPFKITDIKKEIKTTERPLLFDLTTLQREANKKFSYTASKTLEITQALYEKWKVVTYPRTDSSCLSEDMIDPTKELISLLKEKNIFDCQKYEVSSDTMTIDKRVFNNKKVSDHHAIIPTKKILDVDLTKMSDDEINILNLIFIRFFASISKPYKYEETQVFLNVKNYTFKAKGNKTISEGWKSVYKDDEDAKTDEEVYNIPDLQVNQELIPNKLSIAEKEVSPPKLYTEDTLLSAMENCKKVLDKTTREYLSKGIGTPATRAEIIEKLILTEYIKRQKRNLIPTEKGIQFINICDEKLKSIEISAMWEEKFSFIENGSLSVEDFLNDIKNYISDIINSKHDIDYYTFNKKTSIGNCPLCGKDFVEGKNNYYCSGYKEGCKLSISKIIAQKTLSEKNVADLLKKGSTGKIKGFKSKNGNTFEARLKLENEKIIFDFSN